VPEPSPRFPLIDALRGIAATSVVLYHVYLLDLVPRAGAARVEPVRAVLAGGYLGVYIFFVLSGFVIAHSIGGARITPGFIGRFALRRSLRLDPPYWAVIGAALLAAHAGIQDGTRPLPSAGGVVAHLFYLQQFLGIPHLVGVFWTLCLEIQFYLVYVLAGFAAQRLAGGRGAAVFGPLWLVSLLVAAHVLRVRSAVFLWAWPYFFLGALTAWHHAGRISGRTWAIVTGATCLVLLGSYSRWISADDAPARTGVVAATTAALFLAGLARAGERPWLQTVTLGRPLQYLGRISYSLYLVHVLVCAAVARLELWLLGDRPLGAAALLAVLIGGTVLSIGAAQLVHLAVERPAHRLSRRIQLGARREPDRPDQGARGDLGALPDPGRAAGGSEP
jgi:peptidoglycan/LPS O-acetylase OafA/YrhL